MGADAMREKKRLARQVGRYIKDTGRRVCFHHWNGVSTERRERITNRGLALLHHDIGVSQMYPSKYGGGPVASDSESLPRIHDARDRPSQRGDFMHEPSTDSFLADYLSTLDKQSHPQSRARKHEAPDDSMDDG